VVGNGGLVIVGGEEVGEITSPDVKVEIELVRLTGWLRWFQSKTNPAVNTTATIIEGIKNDN
jgi:hypothetical protein